MKTAQLYKFLIACLLIPTLVFANNNTNGKGKHTREKVIKKEFSVNSDATVKVDNRYGNLDIITWDQNRVEFEITITTNGNDEERVQKKLDEITVDFSATTDLVSALTRINKNKSKSWWKWNNSGNVNMKINYIVKMPITNAVDLSNDYGSINLDKLEGRANISCDYGKITTKELLADDNILSFDYTNNSYFEYIKSGKINADYSGFTVAKAKSLDISADYTKSKVEIIEDLRYNCDYGSLKVEKMNSIKGNGDYLTVVLGDVYKNVTIDADYGSIKIENLTKSVKNVIIDSDYVGIKIGYQPEYSFDFDISLEYGSLRDEDGFQFTKKRIESSDKYYRGYHNNENSGNLLKINSEYGSVSFNKN